MKKLLFVLMVLGALVVTGCAAKQVPNLDGAEKTYVEPVIPHEVKNRVDEANRMLDNGDYQDAIRLYDEVLEDYASGDGEFECSVHTNQAIAALSLGDRDNFLYYADRVHAKSLQLKHPSYNSRYVLAVRQAFKNESARDLRVPKSMHEAVFSVLRPSEEGG